MEAIYEVLFPHAKFSIEGHRYDDACFPKTNTVRTLPFLCAIADGAKVTKGAGQWAACLADTFGQGDWSVLSARSKWIETEASSRPRMALAACAALSLLPEPQSLVTTDQSFVWKAVGIGDSCIVHLSADRVCHCFPIDIDFDFASAPLLLASASPVYDEHLKHYAGHYMPGDVFLLMTDGFAKIVLPLLSREEQTAKRIANASYAELTNWALKVCLEFRAKSKDPYDATLVRVLIR